MFLKDKNNFTVSKADAITTARNIGKASFNGSANITLAQIMGHYTTTSSGNGTYNNKWTKFATIDLSSGTYKECTGQLIFTSKESDIFSGILQFYFRTGSAISSTSISLKWTELTNSSYATSVAAVKVSDGKYDLYFKPTANYTIMNITAICQQVGYLTLYSNQSYVDSITAAATSSLSGYVYNASTANTLTTARTINGTSFNGSANITTANWGTARTLTIGSTGKSVNGSGNVSWSLSEIGAAASSHTHNYAGSSSAGGNANAAVKLATARTINGTSFDGTANITTSNWGTARTVKIGNTGKSVNGSANVSWTWNEMQVPRAHSGSYNFGGDQTAITTAQFLTMLADLGAFSQPYWISRGSWSYASNRYINDTGCGNIHLAGCTVEVLGSSTTNCTIRVITPTTSSSGVTNGEFVYINNGDGYSPGWRRQYNTKYKPSASEIGAIPTSGGTVTGDLTLNKYLKINAWSGYGSGTADLWYNGNSGNIHCSSGIRTDKALHSAWHCNFEDGFSIPTRDGGNRRGVLFNTYGSGDNSYLEIVRRNPADTDWDWGNSIKFYPYEVKVPTLQCYGGGGCFKLYPGNAGHTYMGFYLNGSTRGAWMGYGSNGSTQFTISADGGTGRVDIHNLNVHGIPLSIQSSAPGCGGVWIQI